MVLILIFPTNKSTLPLWSFFLFWSLMKKLKNKSNDVFWYKYIQHRLFFLHYFCCTSRLLKNVLIRACSDFCNWTSGMSLQAWTEKESVCPFYGSVNHEVMWGIWSLIQSLDDLLKLLWEMPQRWSTGFMTLAEQLDVLRKQLQMYNTTNNRMHKW